MTRRGVEERLRAALDARAGLITPQSLPPGAPPGARRWGARHVRRTALAVAGAALATLALCLLLLPGRDNR
ncbi:hypothetical protein GCM10009801_33840 [Streptomyces albiaxialis]|uniref:DUF3040 domain-containing protein n=1 Tax=Streptomyces albiaxialis TaxID=329523 RepID=A0ABP5HIM6_9ACTN